MSMGADRGWRGNQYKSRGPGCPEGGPGTYYVAYVFVYLGSKGKAVPLQAWSGPEGSRKLRFPDFMTTARDGGKVVSLTHRLPLPLGNTPGTHFC
jgi:hypothetical protein